MIVHETTCHFVSLRVPRKTKPKKCPLKSLQHKHRLDHVDRTKRHQRKSHRSQNYFVTHVSIFWLFLQGIKRFWVKKKKKAALWPKKNCGQEYLTKSNRSKWFGEKTKKREGADFSHSVTKWTARNAAGATSEGLSWGMWLLTAVVWWIHEPRRMVGSYQVICHFLKSVGRVQTKGLVTPVALDTDTGLPFIVRQVLVVPVKIKEEQIVRGILLLIWKRSSGGCRKTQHNVFTCANQ